MDHINNKHDTQEDYRLENLQLITQAQNLNKERGESTRQLKCKLNKPRSFYEDKLEEYLKDYEQAKKEHNAKLIHLLRGNISSTKARLRYWDSHKDEYESLLKKQKLTKIQHTNWKQSIKDRKLLNHLASEYKAQGDKLRWHQYARLAREWGNYDDVIKEQIMNSILKD